MAGVPSADATGDGATTVSVTGCGAPAFTTKSPAAAGAEVDVVVVTATGPEPRLQFTCAGVAALPPVCTEHELTTDARTAKRVDACCAELSLATSVSRSAAANVRDQRMR